MLIPVVMAEFGHDPVDVFRGLDLAPVDFEDPDHEISYVALSKLIERCVSMTGREDFGLSLGKRSELSTLGIPALMLRFAPDVRSAVSSLVEYLDLHDQGGVSYLDIKEKSSRLGYVIKQPDVAVVDQIYDCAMVLAFRMLRQTLGPEWQPERVSLSHRAPHNPAPFVALFGPRLVFDAARSEIEFRTHWLEKPNRQADAYLFRHFERYAAEMRARRTRDALETMRHFIYRSVLSGSVKYREVAAYLGLRERTLNRRLAADGTSFREELAKVRFELAKQLLSVTNLSITDIAIELNYSETSAFVRAFRSWSGISPGNWRDRACVN